MEGPPDSDSESNAANADSAPFPPTRAGLEGFLSDTLGGDDYTKVSEALDEWVDWASDPTSTVGISLSAPGGQARDSFQSLISLIHAGHADWLVVPAEALYLDAEEAFAQAFSSLPEKMRTAGRNLPGDPFVERTRIRDAAFSRLQLENTELFLQRVILLAAFQGILSTAELNSCYGKYLLARDEFFGIENHSLLAEAVRSGVPLFCTLTDGSVFARQIAAAALTGNRLVVDPSRDLNLAAGLVLSAEQSRKSIVACFGGGAPRDLVLQASRHFGLLLHSLPGHHRAVLEVAQEGRLRLAPQFSKLWPEGGPEFRGIELDTAIAAPLFAAYLIQRKSPQTPKELFEQRDELLEQLREGHLRHDLERQVRETGAHLQAGVREAQDQIQSKIEEQRATFQSEIQRIQEQMRSQMNRFLTQVRDASSGPGDRRSPPTDPGKSDDSAPPKED